MVWVPEFKLYDSTGIGLLYTFPAVNYTNAPRSVEDKIKITNFRSQGAIIVKGGETSWNLEMRFTILGDDYEAITTKIITLENIVQFNVPYILRINKTETSYFEYKVKRIEPFQYENNLRNWKQIVFAQLEVNSW